MDIFIAPAIMAFLVIASLCFGGRLNWPTGMGMFFIGIGVAGRVVLMQSGSMSLNGSVVLDIMTIAGIACLAVAVFRFWKRKKQDKQLRQVREELARNPNREPRQGTPRQRE